MPPAPPAPRAPAPPARSPANRSAPVSPASRASAPVPAAPRREAVLYARVSSKDQEKEGFSIPAQQKLLRGYADDQNLMVVKEFTDVETAKRAGRTQFGKMLEYLKKHEKTCKIILVEKTDRLYRNLKDWVTLDELDLEIHLAKEGVVLSDDSRSSEKFMHGIKVLMAKNYIDNLSEEAFKGMREKAAQGIWPSKAPLGYRNVPRADGKKGVETDPTSAPALTKLFEDAAAGNLSMKDLTKMANAAGLRMRKSGGKIHNSTLHRILRNPFYFGEYDWAGERHNGTHRPLVTRALWERVQAVLDGRYNDQHGKERKNEFPFSGLVRCAHCGCMLTAEVKKEKYVYYHCTGAKGDCGEKYVRQEVLSEQFTEAMQAIRFDAETLDLMRAALRSSHEDEEKFHREAVTRLEDVCARLQKRIDAMYLDKLDGVIDGPFFERHASEWREEQRRTRRLIVEHETANQSYMEEGILLLELAHEAGRLFAKQPADEQRKLLLFLLSNSEFGEGALTVHWRQPFDILAESVGPGSEDGGANSVESAPPSRLVVPTGFEPVSPP